MQVENDITDYKKYLESSTITLKNIIQCFPFIAF